MSEEKDSKNIFSIETEDDLLAVIRQNVILYEMQKSRQKQLEDKTLQIFADFAYNVMKFCMASDPNKYELTVRYSKLREGLILPSTDIVYKFPELDTTLFVSLNSNYINDTCHGLVIRSHVIFHYARSDDPERYHCDSSIDNLRSTHLGTIYCTCYATRKESNTMFAYLKEKVFADSDLFTWYYLQTGDSFNELCDIDDDA